jgi:hypothetical protein
MVFSSLLMASAQTYHRMGQTISHSYRRTCRYPSRAPHLILVSVKSLYAFLLSDVPELDETVRSGGDELSSHRQKVDPEDRIGVSFERLRVDSIV